MCNICKLLIGLMLIGGTSLRASSDIYEIGGDKIFPTPDQILITPTEMYVYTINRDVLIPVDIIAKEEGRVFVAGAALDDAVSDEIPRKGPCDKHLVFHKKCGGCRIDFCPKRCTCFDWSLLVFPEESDG